MQTYNKKQISSGSCLLIDTTAGNRKNYAWGLTNQTNRWLCRVSGAIAVSLAMSLLAATQAVAGNFSITKIADTRSDFTRIDNRAPAINDSGTVAFFAQLLGVYTGSNAGITETLNFDQLQSILGLRPLSTDYGYKSIPYIKNDVTIVLTISQTTNAINSNDAIFVGQDGSFTRRSPSFSAGRNYGDILIGSAINEQDELVYLVVGNSSTLPLYVGYKLSLSKPNQPDVTIAAGNDYVYPGNTRFEIPNAPFGRIGSFAINNKGEVIFSATRQSDNTSAIFTSNGDEPTSILETASLVAVDTKSNSGIMERNPLAALGINDNGDILFLDTNALNLLNRTTGILCKIADTNSSSFQALSNPALNNNQQVAFTATLNSGEQGIFTGADRRTDSSAIPEGWMVCSRADTEESFGDFCVMCHIL